MKPANKTPSSEQKSTPPLMNRFGTIVRRFTLYTAWIVAAFFIGLLLSELFPPKNL